MTWTAVESRTGASGPEPGARGHGTPGVPQTASRWTRGQRAILAAIVLALFAAYAIYSLARHAEYRTTGFDLGIFDQVVRAYSHFAVPTSPLKGIGYNILGDHFHPILAVLAPLYWIWDDPRTLLVVQAALFAVSVVPVAAFVRRRLGAGPALFTAFAYGASWPIERAVDFDFHEIAFAAPLIALLIDALDRRAHRTVVACCALLLLVREDMGALVALTGLFVLLRRPAAGQAGARPRRRRQVLVGGGLIGVGTLVYWLTTSVIIPAFGPAGFAYWTFTQLGPTPLSAVKTALLHPLKVASLVVSPATKFHTLVTIFYPTAFLALFSPYILLSLPFLLERMLNDRPELWTTDFHYTSVVAPIVMTAAADTAGRLLRRFPRILRTRRPARFPRRSWLPKGRSWRLPVGLIPAFVAWSVGVVVVQLAVGAPDYPVSGLFNGGVWGHDVRWHAIHEVLPLIPSGQCVEADNQVAPQLTPRDYVTRVATEVQGTPTSVAGSKGLATWIVLDLNAIETGWQGDQPSIADVAAERRGYVQVWEEWPIVLLHKTQPIAPLCRGLY